MRHNIENCNAMGDFGGSQMPFMVKGGISYDPSGVKIFPPVSYRVMGTEEMTAELDRLNITVIGG